MLGLGLESAHFRTHALLAFWQSCLFTPSTRHDSVLYWQHGIEQSALLSHAVGCAAVAPRQQQQQLHRTCLIEVAGPPIRHLCRISSRILQLDERRSTRRSAQTDSSTYQYPPQAGPPSGATMIVHFLPQSHNLSAGPSC